MNPAQRIAYAQPRFWGNEETRVVEALRSGWISTGPFVSQFEEMVGKQFRSKHALAVSNGTTALHLAYLALGLRAGDEVVIPAFSYLAAANVAIQLGLVPVFADVDDDTFCLTPETVKAVLTDRTKVVVAIHTYGSMCDIDAITEVCSSRGVTVIEDAAEAMGSSLRGRFAGTIAPIGTLSFHAAKTITTGEGGMVLTNDDSLAESMRSWRTHGSTHTRYWHDVPGHNFRMGNLQAAFGCAQMEHWDQVVTERHHIIGRYGSLLGELSGVKLQSPGRDVEPLVWAVAVELDPATYTQGRDGVLKEMSDLGVECRNGFYSPSQMPLYEPYRCVTPVSDRLARNVISLPTFVGLTDAEIDRVVETLRSLAHK